MPYIFNPERLNEIVYGIDGKSLKFDKHGYAETDDAELVDHFINVPGYSLVDEIPAELKQKKASAPKQEKQPDKELEQEQQDNQTDATNKTGVAGYSREELDAMTKADLFALAQELGKAVENPRATKEDLITLILE